jgi:hypothetical protein
VASSPPEEAEADNALATDPNYVHVDQMRHCMHDANMMVARLATANNQLLGRLGQERQEVARLQTENNQLHDRLARVNQVILQLQDE